MGIYGMIRGEMAKRRALSSEKKDIRMVQQLEKLDRVTAETAKTEKREMVRTALRDKKAELRDMKRAKFKEKMAAVGTGVRKFQSGMQKTRSGMQKAKAGLRSSMGSSSGSRDVYGIGSNVVLTEKKKKSIF